MRIKVNSAAVLLPASVWLFLLSGPAAFAATVTIDCAASSSALVSAVNSGLTIGNTYALEGNCLGDVTITTDNVTFENFDPATNDSITGNVTVSGARNVSFFGAANGASNRELAILGTGTDDGSPAGLHATTGASVSLNAVNIENTEENGVLADQGSVVVLVNSAISAAGRAGNAAVGNGIVAQDGATVILAVGSGTATVSGSAGYEILAVTGNVVVSGGTITSTAISAVDAYAGSHLRFVSAHFTASGSQPTILASGSTSLMLQSSSVSAANAAIPAVQVTTGSSGLSGGGNTICFVSGGSCSASGTAVEVDHGSSIVQQNGTAADILAGSGLVQEQSTIELGTGGTTPSSWTGSITVQQNSSLRMSGGMAISGQLVFDQGSNGFFNLANGGSDGVAQGVSCPFTSVPGSQISGPTKITPPVTVSTDFATTTSPTCLSN